MTPGPRTVTTFHLAPRRWCVFEGLFAALVRSLAGRDHPQVPEETR